MLGEFSPEVDWNSECSQPIESLPASFLARIDKRKPRAILNKISDHRRSSSRNSNKNVRRKAKNDVDAANQPEYSSSVSTLIKCNADSSTLNNLKNLQHLLQIETQETNKTVDDSKDKDILHQKVVPKTDLSVLERLLPSRRKPNFSADLTLFTSESRNAPDPTCNTIDVIELDCDETSSSKLPPTCTDVDVSIVIEPSQLNTTPMSPQINEERLSSLNSSIEILPSPKGSPMEEIVTPKFSKFVSKTRKSSLFCSTPIHDNERIVDSETERICANRGPVKSIAKSVHDVEKESKKEDKLAPFNHNNDHNGFDRIHGMDVDFDSSVMDDELIMASQAIIDEEEKLRPEKYPKISSNTVAVNQPVPYTTTLTSSTIQPAKLSLQGANKPIAHRPDSNLYRASSSNVVNGFRSHKSEEVSSKELNQLPVSNVSQKVSAHNNGSEINNSIDSLFMSKSQPISKDNTNSDFDSNDEEFFDIEIESDDSFAAAAALLPLDDFQPMNDESASSKTGSISFNSQNSITVIEKTRIETNTGSNAPPTTRQVFNRSRNEIPTPSKSNYSNRTLKRCSSFQGNTHVAPNVSNATSLQCQIDLKRKQALERLQQRRTNSQLK